MLPATHLFKIGVALDMTGERPMDEISGPRYTHEKRERAAARVLTARDIEVIRVVQGDLPLEPDPCAAAARALETTGQAMARYTAISHCFQRPTYEDWPYTLFSMIMPCSTAPQSSRRSG